jgi:hypothetical protein
LDIHKDDIKKKIMQYNKFWHWKANFWFS